MLELIESLREKVVSGVEPVVEETLRQAIGLFGDGEDWLGGKLLRKGDRGPQVILFQAGLRLAGRDIKVDGDFQTRTHGHVCEFQISVGFEGNEVDGVVGGGTGLALLNKLRHLLERIGAAIHGDDDILLPVQFISQLSLPNPQVACFRAASTMAKTCGALVLGPDHRIQVGLTEDGFGRLARVDPVKAREGISYLDSELAVGRPIVVGVSHMDSTYNVDGITDHFLCIHGRQGDRYVAFDPGTRHLHKARCEFRVDDRGVLVRDGELAAGEVCRRHLEVAMIRMNRA